MAHDALYPLADIWDGASTVVSGFLPIAGFVVGLLLAGWLAVWVVGLFVNRDAVPSAGVTFDGIPATMTGSPGSSASQTGGKPAPGAKRREPRRSVSDGGRADSDALPPHQMGRAVALDTYAGEGGSSDAIEVSWRHTADGAARGRDDLNSSRATA